MIYLKVAHTNDNDADYFSFSNLLQAVGYIVDNNESDWIMSDILFEEVSENDYTFVGVVGLK